MLSDWPIPSAAAEYSLVNTQQLRIQFSMVIMLPEVNVFKRGNKVSKDDLAGSIVINHFSMSDISMAKSGNVYRAMLVVEKSLLIRNQSTNPK